MYKASKGTTLIEILVSVVLITVVLVFIFNILADLKNQQSLSTKKSTDSINRASFTRIIQNDFIDKELKGVSSCSFSDDLKICLTFSFKDNTTKTLKVYSNYIVYDDEMWKLEQGSYLTSNAQICYKNLNKILQESSLTNAKQTEVLNDSSTKKYHLLKITIPSTSNISSSRKYDISITHISGEDLAVSIASNYNSIYNCN